jgi:DNA-binding transcriptional MerR regulator
VKDLDIAQVAQRSGVPASTLRFYEEKGLIASIGRRGLRRLFDPRVLERLALIALGRAAGFSLEEIARMFAPDGAAHRPADARGQGEGARHDHPQTERDARGPAARRCMPRAQLHGMPHFQAHLARRRFRSLRGEKEKGPAPPAQLGPGGRPT